MSPTLTVGVVLDSRVVPAWVAAAIDRLDASAGIHLFCVVLGRKPVAGQNAKRLPGAIYNLIAGIDAQRFPLRHDARAPIDLRETIPFPIVSLVKNRPIRSPQGAEPDLLLYLGETSPPLELGHRSKKGLWFFEIGVDGHLGFKELASRPPTTRIRLLASTGSGDVKLIFTANAESARQSLRRTANRALWTASTLVRPTVLNLAPADEAQAWQPVRELSTRAVVGSGMAILKRSLARRWRTIQGHERWEIRLHDRQGGMPPCVIQPPEGINYADPFLWDEGSRCLLFFEAYSVDGGKGRILAAEVGPKGLLTDPVVVLEEDHHLSYPFVFRWRERLFMIPESSENASIDLYECTKFPFEWRHRHSIMTGIRAVDSTVLLHDERLWLFTTIREHEETSYHDNLHLFHADDPEGSWTPHPANPVKFDVRSSRSAGPILRDRNTLIRPAQDCGERYGSALSLNEIVSLSTQTYREVCIAHCSLRPGWGDGLHSLSTSAAFVATDCRRTNSQRTSKGSGKRNEAAPADLDVLSPLWNVQVDRFPLPETGH
jgi:hypothetical protein